MRLSAVVCSNAVSPCACVQEGPPLARLQNERKQWKELEDAAPAAKLAALSAARATKPEDAAVSHSTVLAGQPEAIAMQARLRVVRETLTGQAQQLEASLAAVARMTAV